MRVKNFVHLTKSLWDQSMYLVYLQWWKEEGRGWSGRQKWSSVEAPWSPLSTGNRGLGSEGTRESRIEKSRQVQPRRLRSTLQNGMGLAQDAILTIATIKATWRSIPQTVKPNGNPHCNPISTNTNSTKSIQSSVMTKEFDFHGVVPENPNSGLKHLPNPAIQLQNMCSWERWSQQLRWWAPKVLLS